MTTLTEADVESAALDWLSDFGWAVAHGPDIAPDTPSAERDDNGQMVLECRPRDALLSRLVSEERRPTSNANGGGSD
jgi:type I restriction enzyme R subunit